MSRRRYRTRLSRDEQLWFRSCSFGAGFGPSTWQGWSATAAFGLAVIAIFKLAVLVLPAPSIALGTATIIVAAMTGWFLRFVERHLDPFDQA